MLCYCCSGKTLLNCCGPYLTQTKTAPNCEALMRSRYSAFCSKNIDYLVATTHSTKQHITLQNELRQFAHSVHFYRLNIISSQQHADQGKVSFEAYFIDGANKEVIVERSDFVLLERWYYLAGTFGAKPGVKIARNDRCPCGSGKKFKTCLTHNISGQTTS